MIADPNHSGDQQGRQREQRAEQDAPRGGSAVYATSDPCWRCGATLYELRPPIDGWRRYCVGCHQLTMTIAETEAAYLRVKGGALGTVVAVSAHLKIEPTHRVGG